MKIKKFVLFPGEGLVIDRFTKAVLRKIEPDGRDVQTVVDIIRASLATRSPKMIKRADRLYSLLNKIGINSGNTVF
jgi:hypothetical protein